MTSQGSVAYQCTIENRKEILLWLAALSMLYNIKNPYLVYNKQLLSYILNEEEMKQAESDEWFIVWELRIFCEKLLTNQ